MTTNKSGSKEGKGGTSSKVINAKSKALSDWRAEMLVRIRAIIQEADPEVVEEVKLALQGYGFFYLTGHGLNFEEVEQRMKEVFSHPTLRV